MGTPHYVMAYQSATRRWEEGCKDDLWEEWLEELGKIKTAWRWSVAGMLTQLDTNDPEIWHALGGAFQGGHGIERDQEQAEKYYRMAANAGNVRSMVRLGSLLCRQGRNSEELAESVEWYGRAAELGYASGMTSLGFAFREGTGVPVDERVAVDWFVKAYAAGAKQAADLAGSLLASHFENHHEAVEWLLIAVEQGNELSNYKLALIYENGESPMHNPQDAFRCWGRVAELLRGDLRFLAMLTLAHWCRDGIGTERNSQEAIRWLDRLMALAPKEKSDYRHAAKLRKEIDAELF